MAINRAQQNWPDAIEVEASTLDSIHVICRVNGTTLHDELTMDLNTAISQMARSGGILGEFEHARPCWDYRIGSVSRLLEVR